jgi:hypothetical protein
MSAIVPSTNRSKQGYVRKAAASIGVKPTNPAWKQMLNESFGLKATPKRGRTKERRADGQAGSTFLTDLENSGPIKLELKFKHSDDQFEAALKGVWANQPYIEVLTLDTEISDVSTTTLTVSAGGASFKAGHLTRTLNLTTAANNRLARVASSGATSIVYPAATFAAEAAAVPVGASVRVVGFQGASGDLVATTTGGNAWTSTALDFTTLGNGVGAGKWMWGGGAAAGDKFATCPRGWHRISTVAANRLSFDIVPSGFVADAGAGKTVQAFTGDFVSNGTTVYGFDFESQQQDIATPTYEYFYDDIINNLDLMVTGGKEIDLSFDFIGNLADAIATARYAGSTDVSPPTYGTMTATNNVGDLAEGGVSLMGGVNCMSAGSIKITNNVTRGPVVGPLGSAAIDIGALTVSGSVDTYLADGSVLAKGVNDTLSAFTLFTGNASGDKEGYRWDVPAIRLTPTSDVQGSNQARKVSGPWEAEPHATLGYTISIGRFWYLPA